MDWHNGSCRKLDLFQADDLQSCLSCGLTATRVKHQLPPICPKKPQVRLLHLTAGSFADAIQCNVDVEYLNFSSEYVALSYTWADENGDDCKCETIIVNGEPFAVTRNCKLALRRVRSSSRTVVIWVDAICIDQNNDSERGHQVKLMPLIYSRAQRVLVYIGESTSHSRHVFRKLETDFLVWQEDVAIAPHDFSIIALKSVLSKRYFTRVWILQEIALAKTATLICGGDSIPWKDFVAVTRLATKSEERPPALDFNRQLCLVPGKELELLDMGRQSQATNPRDKVYALMRLLPNRRIGSVEVDYTLSVAELYSRVALELASSYDWSHVLARAGACYQVTPGLPSWVPDWSFNQIIVSGPQQSNELYEGDRWVRYQPHSNSVHILTVRQTSSVNLGSAPDKIARYKVMCSSHKSHPSKYLRIKKDHKLAELAQHQYRRLPAAKRGSCICPEAEHSLVIDLLPGSDGTAHTLWKASIEGDDHIYVPSETMYEIFSLNQLESARWEIVKVVCEKQRGKPAFSGTSPSDDFGAIIARSSFLEANGAFIKFLETYYLVEEEWVEVR